MSARRIGLITGWLLVVALLGWTAYERQVADVAEAEREAAATAQRQVRAETATLTKRTKQLTAQLATASRQVAAPIDSGVRTSGPVPTQAEIEAELKVRRRAMLELGDVAICRRLGLSAEAARKLADLQEEYSERMRDVVKAARDNEVDLASPGLRPMQDSEQARLRRRIAEELGPDVANAVVGSDRWPAEDVVGQVAADLCFSDYPLSLQQADALEAALEKSSRSTTMAAVAVTRLSRFSPNTPSVAGNIDTYLAQAEALKQAVIAQLAPEQAAIVENRIRAAELNSAVGANAYATWRAIRQGAPPPTTIGLPHE